MKFKLAVSPGTNLKQYSERKPKRKKKNNQPRGVCIETERERECVCARAHACVKLRDANLQQGKEGMRLQAQGFQSHPLGSITEQNSLKGEVLGAKSSSQCKYIYEHC